MCVTAIQKMLWRFLQKCGKFKFNGSRTWPLRWPDSRSTEKGCITFFGLTMAEEEFVQCKFCDYDCPDCPLIKDGSAEPDQYEILQTRRAEELDNEIVTFEEFRAAWVKHCGKPESDKDLRFLQRGIVDFYEDYACSGDTLEDYYSLLGRDT